MKRDKWPFEFAARRGGSNQFSNRRQPQTYQREVKSSETIPPTPITSLDPAVAALKDVRWQEVTTLFTLVAASDIPPSGMVAIMARPQVQHLRRDPLDWRWPWSTGLSGNDLRGS